jgi:hypothetical protein
MAETGHTDEAFALRVYAQMMRRDGGAKTLAQPHSPRAETLAVTGSPAEAPALSTAELEAA